MRKEELYRVQVPFRDDLRVNGFHFGRGELSVCIIGALHGYELQQFYVCACLIKALRDIEERGLLLPDKEIFIIPSAIGHAINTGSDDLPFDCSDITYLFPGNPRGDAAERLADAVFSKSSGYNYGIRIVGMKGDGSYIPHIRIDNIGLVLPELASYFGLPFVLFNKRQYLRKKTLEFNWQKNNTNAFSFHTGSGGKINETNALMSVNAVLRFLSRIQAIKYNVHKGYASGIIAEERLKIIRATKSGIYKRKYNVGDEIRRGEVLGEICDPFDVDDSVNVLAPSDGTAFYACIDDFVTEGSTLYEIADKYE